jgi:hypothetical protein
VLSLSRRRPTVLGVVGCWGRPAAVWSAVWSSLG